MLTQIKRVALLLCLVALTYGCKDSRSGTYLIYDVTDLDVSVTWMPSGYRDSISNEMKNYYSGKQVTLEYTDKYARLNMDGQHLVLTKVMDKKLGEVYQKQHTNGDISIYNTLRKHKDNLVFIVRKSIKQRLEPSKYDIDFRPSELNGIVICYLSKE